MKRFFYILAILFAFSFEARAEVWVVTTCSTQVPTPVEGDDYCFEKSTNTLKKYQSGAWVEITGAGYNRIQDEGSNLGQETTLNFTGAGVSCSTSGGKTSCAVSAGGSQFQTNGTNVTTNDPINCRTTSSITCTNPSAGNIDLFVAADSIGNTHVADAALSAAKISGTAVTQARTVSTTSPLGGGGALSSNLTIAFLNQSANTILAGPTSGGAAAPGFRAIVDGDVPAALARDAEINVQGTANEIASTGAGVAPQLSIASTFRITGKTVTAPIKTGTSLPATCTIGDYFFKTDATVGQNTYACTSTNVWTLQGGAGGGGDVTAVLGQPNEISVINGTGPQVTVGLATNLDLSTKNLLGETPLVFHGETVDANAVSLFIVDPTAPRTITIPDANSATVVPSTAPSNQFATALSGGGIISYAQPLFSNLGGTASDAQIGRDTASGVAALDSSARVIARLQEYTVATLPVTPGTNRAVIVTDANTATTCSAGGGANRVLCIYDGAAWQPISSGGGGGSGDVLSNTGVSIDGEAALFSGTGGKTIKRATGTGVAKLNSGVLSPGTVNLTTEVTSNLPTSRLNSGTNATSTTFWRGDGAWTAVDLANSVTGNLSVANLNGGTGAASSTVWRGDGTWAQFDHGGLAGLSDPDHDGIYCRYQVGTGAPSAGTVLSDCHLYIDTSTSPNNWYLGRGAGSNFVSIGAFGDALVEVGGDVSQVCNGPCKIQFNSAGGTIAFAVTKSGSSPDEIISVDAKAAGTRQVYIDVDAARVAGNCVLADATIPASGYPRGYVTCADTTGDEITFGLKMPANYNGGTVTVTAVAINVNAAPSGTFTLGINGHCTRDGDARSAMNTTGSQDASFTSWAAQNAEEHVTTAAITLNGTCAASASVDLRARVTAAPAQVADIRVAKFMLTYTIQ
jgi:hypothetical protein